MLSCEQRDSALKSVKKILEQNPNLINNVLARRFEVSSSFSPEDMTQEDIISFLFNLIQPSIDSNLKFS